LRDTCSCSGFGSLLLTVPPVDEKRGRALLSEACRNGDSHACGVLGRALHDERPQAAAELLQKACAGQEAWACAEGWKLPDGGVGADGVARLEKLCAATQDCYVLAQVVERGLGVPSDAQRALSLYRAACNSGESHACTQAGHQLLMGQGMPKDPPSALPLYERGCALGDQTSCFNRAWMYESGTGVPADPTRAVALYSELCDLSMARACVSLGYLLEGHEGVEADRERSLAASRRGCELGDPMGCNNTGFAYHQSDAGLPGSRAEAVQWFARGCPADGGATDEGACGMLGVYLLEGQFVPRDDARAFTLLSVGCAAEDGEVCASLAEALAKGRGTRRDPRAAAAAKVKACKLGYRSACR
jgi:hypothetical protein